MKYLKQLALILVIYLAGEGLVLLTGLPLPGNILGMVLLLILLLTGAVRESSIAEVSDFFLDNLAFFFVVPGIQLLESFALLSGYLWQSLLMIALTTLLSLAAAGFAAQLLIRRGKEKEHE